MKKNQKSRAVIVPLLLESATIAIQLKTSVTKRALRRNVSRKVYANHLQEFEKGVVKAIIPLIKEQALSMKKRLEEISEEKSTKISDQASSLAQQVFDPQDQKWRDQLVDKALPVMAVTMLKSMKAAMVEAGVNPTKGLKYNPHHDPRSGRFSSGSGSSARLAPDTGGGTGGVVLEEANKDRKHARIANSKQIQNQVNKMESDRGKLDEKTKAGLGDYTEEYYKEVNSYLRDGGSMKNLPSETQALDKACGQKLSDPVIVYRGTSKNRVEELLGHEEAKGTIIKSKGFVRTSVEFATAAEFASGSRQKSLAIMEIKAKTGLIVGKDSWIPEEFEFIQAPRTKYKYLGKESIKKTMFGEESKFDIYAFEEI